LICSNRSSQSSSESVKSEDNTNPDDEEEGEDEVDVIGEEGVQHQEQQGSRFHSHDITSRRIQEEEDSCPSSSEQIEVRDVLY